MSCLISWKTLVLSCFVLLRKFRCILEKVMMMTRAQVDRNGQHRDPGSANACRYTQWTKLCSCIFISPSVHQSFFFNGEIYTHGITTKPAQKRAFFSSFPKNYSTNPLPVRSTTDRCRGEPPANPALCGFPGTAPGSRAPAGPCTTPNCTPPAFFTQLGGSSRVLKIAGAQYPGYPGSGESENLI